MVLDTTWQVRRRFKFSVLMTAIAIDTSVTVFVTCFQLLFAIVALLLLVNYIIFLTTILLYRSTFPFRSVFFTLTLTLGFFDIFEVFFRELASKIYRSSAQVSSFDFPQWGSPRCPFVCLLQSWPLEVPSCGVSPSPSTCPFWPLPSTDAPPSSSLIIIEL